MPSLFSNNDFFELSHLIMKGENGKYLQGIGLAFTNGLSTPVFESEVYTNMIVDPIAY